MRVAIAASLVLSIVVVVFLILQSYVYERDVDALIDRAQVSADREDMIEYMTQLKQNMEKHEMTHGHFALLFTTPANDLALHFKTVNRILERLESIKNIPKNETPYQVALDDIRGTIRELPNPARGFVWTKYWYLFLCGIGIWLWPGALYWRGY